MQMRKRYFKPCVVSAESLYTSVSSPNKLRVAKPRAKKVQKIVAAAHKVKTVSALLKLKRPR